MRPPPKERNLLCIKDVYKSFTSLRKVNAPKGWTKFVKEKYISFYCYNEYDQAKFRVDIADDFKVNASYYGWGAPSKCYIRSFDVKKCTVFETLQKIESSNICCGTSLNPQAVSHYLTKSSDLQTHCLIPDVKTLTNRFEYCVVKI